LSGREKPCAKTVGGEAHAHPPNRIPNTICDKGGVGRKAEKKVSMTFKRGGGAQIAWEEAIGRIEGNRAKKKKGELRPRHLTTMKKPEKKASKKGEGPGENLAGNGMLIRTTALKAKCFAGGERNTFFAKELVSNSKGSRMEQGG